MDERRHGGLPQRRPWRHLGEDSHDRRRVLDTVQELNRLQLADVGDPEIATRINAGEMAFRLQTSAPDLMNLKSESKETLALYGCDPDKPSFARACARSASSPR